MNKVLLGLQSIFPNFNKNRHYYNARPIELFRISFGVVIILQMLYFFYMDFVTEDLVKPIVHFPFLSFLQPIFSLKSQCHINLEHSSGRIDHLGEIYQMGTGFLFLVFYLFMVVR